MTTVTLNNKQIDMAAARMLMDDDICEKIHGSVDNDQQFIDAYVDAHLVKYGTPFVLN